MGLDLLVTNQEDASATTLRALLNEHLREVRGEGRGRDLWGGGRGLGGCTRQAGRQEARPGRTLGSVEVGRWAAAQCAKHWGWGRDGRERGGGSSRTAERSGARVEVVCVCWGGGAQLQMVGPSACGKARGRAAGPKRGRPAIKCMLAPSKRLGGAANRSRAVDLPALPLPALHGPASAPSLPCLPAQACALPPPRYLSLPPPCYLPLPHRSSR